MSFWFQFLRWVWSTTFSELLLGWVQVFEVVFQKSEIETLETKNILNKALVFSMNFLLSIFLLILVPELFSRLGSFILNQCYIERWTWFFFECLLHYFVTLIIFRSWQREETSKRRLNSVGWPEPNFTNFELLVQIGRKCCRSTSAKPAVRRSPQQRTPQVHQAGIRNRQDIPNSLTNYQTYAFIHLNT